MNVEREIQILLNAVAEEVEMLRRMEKECKTTHSTDKEMQNETI